MKLARIPLHSPPPSFAAQPGRTCRISLAWWDDAEPVGRREPVLVPSPTAAARTLVVVWPTDAQGRLVVEDVRAGRVEVLLWDVERAHLDRLAEIARQGFPLDCHDLRVNGGLWPTPETLRTLPLGLHLEQRIPATIRALGLG